MRFAGPLALLAFAALPAPANDTAVTLGAGGLVPVKSSAIALLSEDLEISPARIAVHYTFRNSGPRDENVTVAFPLPEINGGDVANIPINIPSRDPLNFIDFRVVVDGRKVEPAVEVRAFFEDAEITGRLRSLGIPLSVLDGNVTAAVHKLTPADRTRLERDHWIDCSLTSDGKCWPYWRSRIQFYWTQRFPAGADVDVRHEYRPVVGGSQVYETSDAASATRSYCPTPNALGRIRALQRAHRGRQPADRPVLAERRVDYILTTANNWAGPIRNFRLSVAAAGPDDLVLTCMPGLAQVAPNRYELVRAAFRPEAELHLLVLQPPAPR
jgi:hypothetical protein